MMIRKRQQKGSQSHYLILINRQAANFSETAVRKLTNSIRHKSGFFTTIEADSPSHLLAKGKIACGLKGRQRVPAFMSGRGNVTAIIAAGGDSTVNLAAQLALMAKLPMGIYPLGKYNTIAHSLCPEVSLSNAIETILSKKYRPIDTVRAGNRLVVGSFCMGLLPRLAHLLNGKRPPRFGFRWASLGSKAASETTKQNLTIKVDTFRFDVTPRMFSIHLLPYCLGLAVSPISIPDDGIMEVIFDIGCSEQDLGHYVRDIFKKKYLYGNTVRLFRGSVVHLRPINGQELMIDGEVVQFEEEEVSIQINNTQLKVFC